MKDLANRGGYPDRRFLLASPNNLAKDPVTGGIPRLATGKQGIKRKLEQKTLEISPNAMPAGRDKEGWVWDHV